MAEPDRCPWCGADPLYVEYHDREWGVPIYDDRDLFAKLILDGAQAGLSWITILRRRENYYTAFDGLDPEKMARYDDAKIEELLANPGIIRNRLKVRAARANAQGYLSILEKEGSFSRFLWQFVDGRPVQNNWRTLAEAPAQTKASQAMSRALKGYGFNFVGPTIVYAFMQAVGMVNDHLVDCFRHRECRELGNAGIDT
ncbi:DNA-3-methyladenine glycosylase I [Pseudodesulfovibrio sp.]|uniref:DNA-3-methyladenine glycosylase I n=1 Tax=unclassified Pseudodesulfovibrio TaxID=2661612 RepID=UPI003AFFE225